jgi:asparagine synthase (glutamine-hydrolysing)
MELGLEEMDKNASDHSLESRYPFLDRRLVEFCLALPPEQRIRNGYTRWIERAALAENLPPEIYQRVTKSLADPYIRFSLIKFERNHMKDVLSCCKNLVRPYVDLDSIYEAYHNLTSGTTGNLTPLWRTVLLALWLHQEHLTKSKKGT